MASAASGGASCGVSRCGRLAQLTKSRKSGKPSGEMSHRASSSAKPSSESSTPCSASRCIRKRSSVLPSASRGSPCAAKAARLSYAPLSCISRAIIGSFSCGCGCGAGAGGFATGYRASLASLPRMSRPIRYVGCSYSVRAGFLPDATGGGCGPRPVSTLTTLSERMLVLPAWQPARSGCGGCTRAPLSRDVTSGARSKSTPPWWNGWFREVP